MSPFNLYDTSEDTWKWQEYLTQPISPALRAILCKLLQPATRRRYQSAVEVLADLDVSSSPGNNPLLRKEAESGDFTGGVFPPDPRFKTGASAQAVQAGISNHCRTYPTRVENSNQCCTVVCSNTSTTVYNPQTQAWYYLPTEIKARSNSMKYTSPTKKRTYFSRLFTTQTTDAIELIFVAVIFFILTCAGSMLMLGVFIQMEEQSHHKHNFSDRTSPSSKL